MIKLQDIPILQNTIQGQYNFRFRRHLPDLPDNIRIKGESLDQSFTNALPWSDPITVTFTNSSSPTPTPTPLSGDLDHNGKVDISDYNTLLQNFGNTTCDNVADIDGTCTVDIFDYNILVGNFGKTQ